MSDLSQNLENIILKAGIDGALTEEAVAQFHALVKQRDSLDTENKRLDDRNTELEERVTKLAEDYNDRQNKLQGWATREQELKDREATCTKLEVEKECAELRVKDHKEMFTTVFRNSVLRKEVMTPVGAGPIDQYGTKQSDVYPSRDTVEEEET